MNGSFWGYDIINLLLGTNMHKLFIILLMSLLSFPVFSQTENDTTSLGLPGDNLDLYAVLDLFQKSKTIEDFEKSLNEEKTGINNLDLNLDNKADFIKVTTKQKEKDFTFILQVDVAEKETQDVAVILLSKDENNKVTMQIVGDVDLYGKDYVIEPKPAVTPNPGYKGKEPVTVNDAATTTVVVVESAPIVQYVYSPGYVPYYPPYHYGYYPPYFAAFTIMAVGIYRHNNYYHHGGYYGGYSHNVVVRNTNVYNNYNNSRNRSNTVNHNKANGNYNRNNVSNNRSKGPTTTTRKSTTDQSKRPTTTTKKPTTNQSKGPSTTSKRQTNNQLNKSSTSSSRSNFSGSSRSRSGGGYGGGGSRGGGGGGGRRR